MTPPLLRLPAELHQEIIDGLELHDKARLALTNRYFAATVQPPTLLEILAAETNAWAISKDLYACAGCGRLQRLREFADDMRKGRRARGRQDARTRSCIKCGIQNQLYTPGTEFNVMGERYVVCMLCGTCTDRVGSEGACHCCSPSSRSLQKRRTIPRSSEDYYESDDDWAYSIRSCTRGKHSEEMYGAWPDI